MGMIVHYNRYPASASCTHNILVHGVSQSASFNDTFDYTLMPTYVTGSTPGNQRTEVAKLLRDCGISIGMQYDSGANGGSGAWTTDVVTALKNTFGYASASWRNGSDSDWATVLQNELNGKYVAELEIYDTTKNPWPGHAIVCDGWGTDNGALRFHLNMGWGGSSNNWYQVPGFTTGNYTWTLLTGYVYNVRVGSIASLSLVPAGGTYGIPQDVTVTCPTAGTTIHYTTNGSDPTETDPVVISGSSVAVAYSMTLKTRAFKVGWTPSAVKSGVYTINIPTADTPTYSPSGGTYNAIQDVTISTTTTGATIHYTSDGTDPDETDPVPSGAIHVDHSLTLKARAYKSGLNSSEISTAGYTINYVFTTGGFLKAAKWNLVSIPVDPINPDPIVVFSAIDVPNANLQSWNDISAGFTRYGSAWGWTGPIVRGKPYWFLEPDATIDKDIGCAGVNPTNDFILTVPSHPTAPFWIMFGTPFPSAISTDSVLFKNVAKRGDVWLTWMAAYSNGDSNRIVESNAQGWYTSNSGFIGVAPSGYAGIHYINPWWGYWLMVCDTNELLIKFPKP